MGAEGEVLLPKERPPDRERASAISAKPAPQKAIITTSAAVASFFEPMPGIMEHSFLLK
jgi:hypothetical protein